MKQQPTRWHRLACGAVALAWIATGGEALAQGRDVLVFETELVSLQLTGGPFPMPLASDPANLLGDSVEGFGFVNSLVTVTLSSQRNVTPGPPSLGRACAFPSPAELAARLAGGGCGGVACDPDSAAPIVPADLHGDPFAVHSFFDVFFDITVTDVDTRPGRDYAGQSDGASLMLVDNGPACMQSFHTGTFDMNAPNFSLLPPPEADPYIGHFQIEIPLGGDINGNGENDKIKFTLATHSAGDQNRTFIVLPDGTVLDTFDSAAFLQGAVVDQSTDPPFQIGELMPNGLPDPNVFGGPTTASARLANPIPVGVESQSWSVIKNLFR